jgi:hypothetical protein
MAHHRTTVDRDELAVRCRRNEDRDVVLEVHRAGTRDDCLDCTWHVRLTFEGPDLSLAAAAARGVPLPVALSQLQESVPLAQWHQLARRAAPADGYLPLVDLAELVVPPPRRELQRLVAAGEPWGVAPTRLVAGHYGVSVQTAHRWLTARRDRDAAASPS